MATVLVNPLPKILGKFSKFHEFTGSLIHYFRLITNLSDSASSDTMTLARASSKTFIPDSGSVTTVTSNNAAFTGSGVLIEKSHENVLLYSQQLDNAAWTKSGAGATITPNTTLAPDGTTTADTFTAGTSGSGNVQQTVTASGSTNVVFQWFFKPGNAPYVLFRLLDVAVTSGDIFVYYDTSDGSVASTSESGFTLISATAVPVDNGFYQAQIVATVDRNFWVLCYPCQNFSPFSQNSTDTVILWQADLFKGHLGALSSVTTTTAAATSLKDDLSMALDEIPANDFYIEFDWTPLSTAANGDYLLSFTSGSGGNEIFVGAGANRIESNGGASVTSFTPSVGTTYKIRLTRTSTGGETLSIAGVGSDNEPAATADITWPSTGTIGSRYSGGNHSHSVIANVKVGDA